MSSIFSSMDSGGMSSASSIRGFGGLASGLDRDTLIENMTAATRSKIAKQKQQKQTFLWKQEAYRSISSKLVEFSRKYMSYTNQSTNLSSSSFWARSSVTAVGANSSYVSVSGSSALADSVSIKGVKQLAEDASMTSKSNVSDQLLTTGDINFTGTEPVSMLEGGYLSFKYGTKTYSVSLTGGTTSDGFTYDYSNGAKAEESITRALKNVSIGNGKTLADVIEVTSDHTDPAEAAGTDFELNIKSTDTAGNTLMLTGGSTDALKAIGFSDLSSLSDSDKTISDTGLSATRLSNQDFFEDKTFEERAGGKNISFTYNGTTKSIQLANSLGDINALQADIQDKLDTQFGTNRIKVGTDGNKLTFKTWNPATDAEDKSSILSISSADTGVIGKNGALKVEYGESNRLNMTASLADSGLDGIAADVQSRLAAYKAANGGEDYDTTYFSGSVQTLDIIEELGSKITASTTVSELKDLISSNYSNLSDTEMSRINEAIDQSGASTVTDLKTDLEDYVDKRELKLKINGEDIKGLTYNSTFNEIIEKVNASDAGVTMSYMKNADKFSIISTAGGAAGEVKIEGADAEMLFGTEDTGSGGDYTVSAGQDAIVAVKYDGSDEVIELVRGNNSFDLDGLNISVNGTFGYSGGVLDPAAEAVTFDAKTDTDKIVTAVTDMIKDYNEILDLVHDEVTTKPNRSYAPLTDEQKEDMKDEQIEKWNDKAKKGMLFNDPDLRGLTDSLRFILDSGSQDKAMLASFGITTSSDYGDNGKLVLNETKFKAALESNPEDLQKLFTKSEDTITGEKGGVMSRIRTVTEKYASTTGATKGILIERAGSTYAPTSVLSNSLQKSMDSFDDHIKRLQSQLKTETDRYIKQFTNLETVISQMNSQSSYLSSLSS